MKIECFSGGAMYNLGYELNGDQPVISLHTDPAKLEGLQNSKDDLDTIGTSLGIASPFTFDTEAFGYEGVGVVRESTRVAGWTALRLALPKPASDARYLGAPTPQVLPIVTTLSVALQHLESAPEGKTDPENPQLITANLVNRTPLNSQYSAPVRATITPAALERLSAMPDLGAAEEQVNRALFTSFQYPYGHADKDRFDVQLDIRNGISFDYQGDGSFSANRRSMRRVTEGMTLDTTNNDYTIQQLGIMGGLGALNNIVLGLAEA